MKFNRKMWFKGQLMKASEIAASIPPEDRKLVEINGERQWYWGRAVRENGLRLG